MNFSDSVLIIYLMAVVCLHQPANSPSVPDFRTTKWAVASRKDFISKTDTYAYKWTTYWSTLILLHEQTISQSFIHSFVHSFAEEQFVTLDVISWLSMYVRVWMAVCVCAFCIVLVHADVGKFSAVQSEWTNIKPSAFNNLYFQHHPPPLLSPPSSSSSSFLLLLQLIVSRCN